eukprot:487164-Rhodomonas_salina.1
MQACTNCVAGVRLGIFEMWGHTCPSRKRDFRIIFRNPQHCSSPATDRLREDGRKSFQCRDRWRGRAGAWPRRDRQ